ncbi:MAG: hypothetical protein ACRD3W_06540 [Terriglobales bacterium]
MSNHTRTETLEIESNQLEEKQFPAIIRFTFDHNADQMKIIATNSGTDITIEIEPEDAGGLLAFLKDYLGEDEE